MLAGSLDPAHQICVSTGERGLQLVMHHRGSCVAHHHGIIARTLTLFAQPATTGNPDHVIQFGAGENHARPVQISSVNRVYSEQAPLVLAAIPILVSSSALTALDRPRPPSAELEQLLCLRSTVLLI